MRLYILRHAEAEATHPDPERALTKKGRRTAEQLGRFLLRSGINDIGRVIHSPYRRAVETAVLCLDAMGTRVAAEPVNGLTPEDDTDEAVRIAREAEESLLIVGHNPHLSLLVARLLTGRDLGMGMQLKKGSLVCLESVPSIHVKAGNEYWTLRWAVTPKLYMTD